MLTSMDFRKTYDETAVLPWAGKILGKTKDSMMYDKDKFQY